MVFEAHVLLYMTARFFEKKKKLPKMGGNWAKNRVFEFIGKVSQGGWWSVWSKMGVVTLVQGH